MQTFLLTLSKTYIRQYDGISPVCWRGIFFSFIESNLIGVFYFLSIYFVDVLQLKMDTTGIIIACYGLGAILGGLISGKLSDKISPTWVSASSLLIQALGYFILVKIENIHLLMINLFMLGVSTYSFITSNQVWVLNQCETQTQKLKAINLLSTASNLGLGISAIFIGRMTQYGFHFIFILSASLLSALACYLFFQEKFFISNKQKILNASVTPYQANKNQWITWLILFWVLLIGAIVSQRSSTYSIYIRDHFPQFGIKGVSYLFTINSFLVVIFSTPLGNWFSQSNKILIVGMSGFLIGFGMLMLSFSSFFTLAVLACIIYTLGEMLFFCMAQFICYEKGELKKKGYSLGKFRMMYATSRAIGPLLGGLIYHHLADNILWYLSGIIGLSCLVVCNHYKSYD